VKSFGVVERHRKTRGREWGDAVQFWHCMEARFRDTSLNVFSHTDPKDCAAGWSGKVPISHRSAVAVDAAKVS